LRHTTGRVAAIFHITLVSHDEVSCLTFIRLARATFCTSSLVARHAFMTAI
jgi:hypothetical protein